MTVTPLGALARGLGAGIGGTAAMTAWQRLAAELRDSGDRQSGERSWDDAPVPAQVGRRIMRGVFHQDVPADKIPLLTNVVHWAYGTGWGAVYGLVQATVRANPALHGLLFGTG